MSEIEASEMDEGQAAPVANDEQATTAAPEQPVETDESESGEETATSEEGEQEPAKPKRSRRDARIDRLSREKYEAEQQAQAYRQQLEQLARAQQEAQLQQSVGKDMPSLSDYNYDEAAFGQAMQAWTQQQFATYQQSLKQQAEQQQAQQAAWQEQQRVSQAMAEGAKKYPDFMAKVMDPNLPPLRQINPAAYEAVVQSDVSIDVAYYLANNPQDVYAFQGMTPVQVGKRMAELEAMVRPAKPSKPPPPRPPSTVSGASEATPDPSKMSTQEWMAWRNSNLKR